MSNEPREAKALNKVKEQADMNKNKLNSEKHKMIHFKKIKCKNMRVREIEI